MNRKLKFKRHPDSCAFCGHKEQSMHQYILIKNKTYTAFQKETVLCQDCYKKDINISLRYCKSALEPERFIPGVETCFLCEENIQYQKGYLNILILTTMKIEFFHPECFQFCLGLTLDTED